MASQNLMKRATELEQKRVSFAWATVVGVKGSAPRHMGAKMIITVDEIFGTLGGGALEYEVIKNAREQIKQGTPKTFNYPLGPLLGQCCGGEVDVFIEPVTKKKDIVVFGAGHISEELVPMLDKLGFNVTLVDERYDRINLAPFEGVYKKFNEIPEDALGLLEFHDELYAVVLTHAHIHDEKIVEYCLDKPYRYLGVIGSRTKWKKFVERYKSRGFTIEQLGKVTTPIGLDIGSETPFEIAISIIAEIILLDSRPKGFGEYRRC